MAREFDAKAVHRAGFQAMARSLYEQGIEPQRIEGKLRSRLDWFQKNFGERLTAERLLDDGLPRYQGNDRVAISRTKYKHVKMLNTRFYGVYIGIQVEKPGEYRHYNVVIENAVARLLRFVKTYLGEFCEVDDETDLTQTERFL